MDVFVRQGDSLYYFSQLFDIPLQLILDSNQNISPQDLSIGQRIQIPGYVGLAYQIRRGESLWAIAQSRKISVDGILLANPNIMPNSLQVGQTIKIPLRITWRVVTGKRDYDYNSLVIDIRRLQTVYPFLKISSIGSSVMGKDLQEIVVGNGNKRVHFDGSFHANEWITTPIIMTFLDDYLLSLTNGNTIRGIQTTPLYDQTFLSIVPMVNPDGVDLVINGPPSDEPYRSNVIEWNKGSTNFSGWKANINGVDLNDQFPALWELERDRNPKSPGPRDYGGEAPLTQPEAIAMADLTRRRDFARVLPFHTQGQVIYWGFENLQPPENEVLAIQFGEASGYIPIETTNSYAGYKDWFIQDWRRPGFTVELGIGTNPLPLSQFDEIYEDALGIFLAALYL